MEFKGIEERVRDSVGSEILKRHMSAASEKRNKGADITKRALSGGLPAPTTTERPTQALGGQPVGAFGNQTLQEGITRNALKGSSSQIKNFIEGTPPPSQDSSPQVPTFNADQFRKDIVNKSMQKNLQERGSILAPGGKITKKSEVETGGRGEVRENANGMVQTGTSTSPRSMSFDDANGVLAKYGISNNGFGEKFSSNQLPGTKGSPYGESSGADNQVMGGSARDSAVIEGGGSVETVIGGDTDLDSVKSTYSGGDKSARRRAFLDYSGPGGAMGAMRAAEAADGVMYAGGKHHIANPNAGEEGQNDFMAINKDEARQIQFGKQSAQGLRDQYVNKLTGNESAQEIGEASQNAPAMLPDAVPGNTPMDKSPFDTEELMQQRPGKSIIGNNTPYTSAKPGTLY